MSLDQSLSIQKLPRNFAKLLSLSTALIMTGFAPWSVDASGIYRNGVGARAMSLGGADVAWAGDALGAMSLNPAGLGFLKDTSLDVSFAGALLDAKFTNPVNRDGYLKNSLGGLADAALAIPVGSTPVTLGLGVIPDSLLSANWRYTDAPGGLDGVTSYGFQKHHSEIILLRTALGAGVALGEKISVGASLGVVYNRNTLQSPYIFQEQPALRGAKTLLDLGTDGFGVNGNFGVLFRPHPDWQIGLAYRTETRIRSHGEASGNAGVQLKSLGGLFALARPDFHYDAEVVNTFPQMISGGVSWRAHPRLRLTTQVDWVNWHDAFDRVRIKLSNGDNADLNGLAGGNSLEDSAPLNWKDAFVYRAGVDFAVSENFHLRGGYSYGRNPVPAETLTPLTAAIAEHTFTAGIGFTRGRYQIDFAYQYDLPVTGRVDVSALRSGEYSRSEVDLSIHWIGLTTSIRF
ncbi:MAG: TonB-dependent receptor [Verrucomicrobia bacterium]|nr:TonB-dependent receptor [Verrucomicrobiota bacterium]